MTNGVCIVPRLSGGPERVRGLVTVDRDPQGVTAVWIPSLSQRPCRTATIRAGASVAARLAEHVRSAPGVGAGKVACPKDDGSAVELFFAYGSGHALEYVSVALRGCAFVAAPGRAARQLTIRLLRDLAGLAPQPWADTIRQRTG
jgi:hypothetical protein